MEVKQMFDGKTMHMHWGHDFSAFFHALPCGAALHALVYNSKGEPDDYITLDVNSAFEEKMKLRRNQILSRPASERMSSDELRHWLDLFTPVVQNDIHTHFDMYDKDGRRYKALASSPGRNLFLIFFSESGEYRDEFRVMEMMRNSYSVLNDLHLRIFQDRSIRPDIETGIILERVCRSLDLDFGALWLSDGNDSSYLVNSFNPGREMDPGTMQYYPRLFPCVTEKMLNGGGSFFISRDMLFDRNCQDLQTLDRLGVQHLFFADIHVPTSKTPGLICFATSRDNPLFGHSTKGYLDLVVLYIVSLFVRVH